MRICVIGKYPPIQGGVSMRTYLTAHGLAARGHEMHVVTNAREVRSPFRMYMRPQDWQNCNAQFETGSVEVHWTDPVDRSQTYIPMASPFVTKLAGIAAHVHSERPFDVIFSHYLEPYGVAGHLAAQMTGVPHVVRMAGSDAGRLWRHPQLEATYDFVLRSADIVVATGPVKERALARGIDSHRIASGAGYAVPEDLFAPAGPLLDLNALRKECEEDPELKDQVWGASDPNRPHFGIYGKLGDNKGTFALLAALRKLKKTGLDVGLVALAHGQPAIQKRFRQCVQEFGLADRVLQIPFLPHWRVAEFIRGCLAVCCLEQDFPIGFHTPIIPREVLLCGSCLVASTEVIRKLPDFDRLPHGYGCVAIDNVNDVDALANALACILREPGLVRPVGARGRAFALEMQRDIDFPSTIENILEAAARRQKASGIAGVEIDDETTETHGSHFLLTDLAAKALRREAEPRGVSVQGRVPIDLLRAREILAELKQGSGRAATNLKRLIPAVVAEIATAAAELQASTEGGAYDDDGLFRLKIGRWAMDEGSLVALFPVRPSNLRIVAFDYDVSEFLGARTIAECPEAPTMRNSYVVIFGGGSDNPPEPLLVDGLTARALELSDGTRAVGEILVQLERERPASLESDRLEWIEILFRSGLLGLRSERVMLTDLESSANPTCVVTCNLGLHAAPVSHQN